MWFPTSKFQGDSATFVLSAWHELFHAFTPDSFQPKLHNVSSLVAELNDVGTRFQSEPKLRYHVQSIREELKWCIEAEADVLDLRPRLKSHLHELIAYESAPGIVASSSILQESMTDYFKALNERLSNAIDGLPRAKSIALQNVRRLSTIAFQLGKEDDDVWNGVVARFSNSPKLILEQITKAATEAQNCYECVFAIVGNPSETNSISRMNEFAPTSRLALPIDFLESIDASHDKTIFVSKTISASSIRNAVSQGVRRLSVATGISSLYRNSHTFHVHNRVLVRCGLQETVFSQSDQAFRRLYPRRNANSDIRECTQLLTQHSVDDRLLGALELLSIASANTDARVRLINLWSSVETLAGAHEAETTLERVVKLLIPLIASRYVARITRYLAIELHHLGKHKGRFDFGNGFKLSGRKFVDPCELLQVLTAKRNSVEICDLLRFADHPLLRYHVFEAWNKFSDPRVLRNVLANSSKRLHWHIARIYRARNMLVHQGEEPLHLVPLLDNLQNYLAMAIQRMIHEMKLRPTWTVRQVNEYWISRHQHILNSLDRSPGVLTLADFIDDAEEQRLWAD